jgi:hypothetical protein
MKQSIRSSAAKTGVPMVACNLLIIVSDVAGQSCF